MGKDKKKQGKPKNPFSNFKPQLPKGKKLIGHLDGKPLYSVNGCAPAVVTDEMKNAGKLRSIVVKKK